MKFEKFKNIVLEKVPNITLEKINQDVAKYAEDELEKYSLDVQYLVDEYNEDVDDEDFKQSDIYTDYELKKKGIRFESNNFEIESDEFQSWKWVLLNLYNIEVE